MPTYALVFRALTLLLCFYAPTLRLCFVWARMRCSSLEDLSYSRLDFPAFLEAVCLVAEMRKLPSLQEMESLHCNDVVSFMKVYEKDKKNGGNFIKDFDVGRMPINQLQPRHLSERLTVLMQLLDPMHMARQQAAAGC